MSWPTSEVLYSAGEVLYECQGGRVWFWTLASGRQFAWEAGVLSVRAGLSWVSLSRQPSWEAGIQFSCGFECGREIPTMGAEGEV